MRLGRLAPSGNDGFATLVLVNLWKRGDSLGNLQAVALLDIEDGVRPAKEVLALFVFGNLDRRGLLGVLGADLPEKNLGSFLALPHSASKLLRLLEGQPIGRAVRAGPKDEDVCSPVGGAGFEVAWKRVVAAVALPWLGPRNDASFEGFNNSGSNGFVGVSHGPVSSGKEGVSNPSLLNTSITR